MERRLIGLLSDGGYRLTNAYRINAVRFIIDKCLYDVKEQIRRAVGSVGGAVAPPLLNAPPFSRRNTHTDNKTRAGIVDYHHAQTRHRQRHRITDAVFSSSATDAKNMLSVGTLAIRAKTASYSDTCGDTDEAQTPPAPPKPNPTPHVCFSLASPSALAALRIQQGVVTWDRGGGLFRLRRTSTG